MAILNSIADRKEYWAGVRQFIHQHPELGFETKETAKLVVSELKKMGISEVYEGIAKNGVLAVVEGQKPGRTIALRADMDALPITEETGEKYSSKKQGIMHACGHDGHTATLLAAAEHLIANNNFSGKVVLVFQPAEEGGGGGRVMVEDGFLDRMDVEEVYALHNFPGHEFGKFMVNDGAMMASTDTITITITGKGGHAAFPELSTDPVPIAMRLIEAIYALRTREVAPQKIAVISITKIIAGTASNIIPETVEITGTIRTLDNETRLFLTRRINEIATELPKIFGATAECRINDGYPVTKNTPQEAEYAKMAASSVASSIDGEFEAQMGAEDFAYFLNERPGAYAFFGAGDGAPLHHPKFNFNDELIPVAASYFVNLVSQRLSD